MDDPETPSQAPNPTKPPITNVSDNPPTDSTPPPDPDPDPTMALAALPTYFSYSLNILCGPYPNPFFVHIFLGPIPQIINYEDPYSIPSWVGQDAIYPAPPPGSTHKPPSPSPYTHDLSASSPELAPGPERRPPTAHPLAPPLPTSYTASAVRSSQPLTSAIVARLHAHGASDLSAATVTRYLQTNLQWRLAGSGIPDRKRISVEKVPIRLWVVRQNVTPPADTSSFPVYGESVVVWEASRGKLGGLERGEVPGVG